MPKDPTKAELVETLAERDAEIRNLNESLTTAGGEKRRAVAEAERQDQRIRALVLMLTAGKQAIVQNLNVLHHVELEPAGDYLHGEFVEHPGTTNEVRFLRHLYGMLGSDIPF